MRDIEIMERIKRRPKETTPWKLFVAIWPIGLIGVAVTHAVDELTTVGIFKANMIALGLMLWMWKSWNTWVELKLIEEHYYELCLERDREFYIEYAIK